MHKQMINIETNKQISVCVCAYVCEKVRKIYSWLKFQQKIGEYHDCSLFFGNRNRNRNHTGKSEKGHSAGWVWMGHNIMPFISLSFKHNNIQTSNNVQFSINVFQTDHLPSFGTLGNENREKTLQTCTRFKTTIVRDC